MFIVPSQARPLTPSGVKCFCAVVSLRLCGMRAVGPAVSDDIALLWSAEQARLAFSNIALRGVPSETEVEATLE